MAKLTIVDVENLQNENSAVATMKSNNTAIEAAVENTLSRDGTAPNQMGADFDMNSYRVLNLPKPVNADEPLRLQDLSDFYSTGSVSNIPAGGNSGDVLAKTAATNYAFGWVSDASLVTAGDNIVTSGTSPVTIGTSLTPTFTTVNGLTLTTGTGTLTLGAGKTATVSNTLTFTGTDGSSAAFGAGGTVAYKETDLSQFATTTSAQLAGVVSDETGSGSLVFATSPSLITPNLDTPSAVVLTNGTGLPIATGVSGLASGIATFLNSPTSAHLKSAITDETGNGFLVFATSPNLITPNLGTPSACVATNLTGTAAGLTAGNVTTNANLTGDVTSVGNASTIATNAVTNAKLATATDGTIKSNISGSTAAPSDNTITAVLDKQFGTTQGSVIYRGASAWAAIGPGTSGNFLQTQGAAANPTWSAVPGGGDLLSTNNLSDLTNKPTALTNLGGTTIGKDIFTGANYPMFKSQVFTASGTFTTPSNSSTNTVYHYRCLGGGGGGGGANGANSTAGGGGGGAYAEGTFTGVSASTGITITIGAAGTAGAAASSGGTGGTSSIGSPVSISCSGGVGGIGTGTGNNSGGAGGTVTGSPNILSISGRAGSPGLAVNTTAVGIGGGDGADTPLGVGGVGGRNGVSSAAAVDATGYGAGGGAGFASGAGKVGTQGIVIISWILQ